MILIDEYFFCWLPSQIIYIRRKSFLNHSVHKYKHTDIFTHKHIFFQETDCKVNFLDDRYYQERGGGIFIISYYTNYLVIYNHQHPLFLEAQLLYHPLTHTHTQTTKRLAVSAKFSLCSSEKDAPFPFER